MTARPLPPAPSFLTSAVRVMDLSIGEMLWSRRTVFMALIVSAPVLISLMIRLLSQASPCCSRYLDSSYIERPVGSSQ